MTHHICLVGTNKSIEKNLISRGIEVKSYGRNTKPSINFLNENISFQAQQILAQYSGTCFVIATGFLQPKPITLQTSAEISRSFLINSAGPVIFSEYILSQVENARVILIGSESGKKGSYDLSYALSKSSLRMYVTQKIVAPCQQLLLISPSTISDFGMTIRRKDMSRLENYRCNHPKQRFLEASELCDLIVAVLNSTNYLTNIEIDLNGGKFARMKNHD